MFLYRLAFSFLVLVFGVFPVIVSTTAHAIPALTYYDNNVNPFDIDELFPKDNKMVVTSLSSETKVDIPERVIQGIKIDPYVHDLTAYLMFRTFMDAKVEGYTLPVPGTNVTLATVRIPMPKSMLQIVQIENDWIKDYKSCNLIHFYIFRDVEIGPEFFDKKDFSDTVMPSAEMLKNVGKNSFRKLSAGFPFGVCTGDVGTGVWDVFKFRNQTDLEMVVRMAAERSYKKPLNTLRALKSHFYTSEAGRSLIEKSSGVKFIRRDPDYKVFRETEAFVRMLKVFLQSSLTINNGDWVITYEREGDVYAEISQGETKQELKGTWYLESGDEFCVDWYGKKTSKQCVSLLPVTENFMNAYSKLSE